MKNLQIVRDLIKNRDLKLLELAYEDLGLYGSLRSREVLDPSLFLVKSKTKKREPSCVSFSPSWNKKTGVCGTPPYSRQTVLALFPVFSFQEAGNTKPHNKKIKDKGDCPLYHLDFYFVDGTKAPCSFMINSQNVISKEKIKQLLRKKIVPLCCNQCGELTGKRRTEL